MSGALQVRPRALRTIVAMAVAGSLVLTALPGCATAYPDSCRSAVARNRARRAARGLGIVVISVVWIAAMVVSHGQSPTGLNGGGVPSRAERRRRRTVTCPPVAATTVAATAPGGSAPADGSPGAAGAAPPTVDATASANAPAAVPPERAEVEQAIAQAEPALRACARGAGRALQVDLVLDGGSGRVARATTNEDPTGQVIDGCVARALESIEVPRFDGTLEVRALVPLDG